MLQLGKVQYGPHFSDKLAKMGQSILISHEIIHHLYQCPWLLALASNPSSRFGRIISFLVPCVVVDPQYKSLLRSMD